MDEAQPLQRELHRLRPARRLVREGGATKASIVKRTAAEATFIDVDFSEADFEETREARRRFRLRPERPIGVALFDQTVIAGAGNIYRSEVFFLCGVHPRGVYHCPRCQPAPG